MKFINPRWSSDYKTFSMDNARNNLETEFGVIFKIPYSHINKPYVWIAYRWSGAVHNIGAAATRGEAMDALEESVRTHLLTLSDDISYGWNKLHPTSASKDETLKFYWFGKKFAYIYCNVDGKWYWRVSVNNDCWSGTEDYVGDAIIAVENLLKPLTDCRWFVKKRGDSIKHTIVNNNNKEKMAEILQTVNFSWIVYENEDSSIEGRTRTLKEAREAVCYHILTQYNMAGEDKDIDTNKEKKYVVALICSNTCSGITRLLYYTENSTMTPTIDKAKVCSLEEAKELVDDMFDLTIIELSNLK